MSEASGKMRKPIWMKFVVLILLLVSTGFSLTACQQPQQGDESTEQEEDQPNNSNQENENEDEEDEDEDSQEDDDPE
jgi:hypothetical protein